ncbi:BBT_HP_G0133410.mRNA.1.CDS.1 [Saccharomyces cerevisiae]|nr:BBT_HP_G0133410.mRNA.1.CDS.1 [Saccharomyces cerevisiae]CAI6977075.1 BBT_HP_G0133410.mRNA.1.CDS.1 [Saccharomyces cerevisiae]
MYGTILGNIGAALIGGPGLVAGANFGRDYAVFEPGSRHVGLDIKGQNVVNPTAMILFLHVNVEPFGFGMNMLISESQRQFMRRSQKVSIPLEILVVPSTTDFTNEIINKLSTM